MDGNNLDRERRINPVEPIDGFDPRNDDGTYNALDLLEKDISTSLDVKYTLIKNIFSENTLFYRNDLEKRPNVSTVSKESINNLFRQYNNTGDKYTDDDLKDLYSNFIERNSVGTNVVSMTYKEDSNSELEVIPNYYRVLPE